MVVSMLVKNCNASGNVASDLSAASLKPTNAEVAISSELPEFISAWQPASSQTLRFIMFIFAFLRFTGMPRRLLDARRLHSLGTRQAQIRALARPKVISFTKS